MDKFTPMNLPAVIYHHPALNFWSWFYTMPFEIGVALYAIKLMFEAIAEVIQLIVDINNFISSLYV
jgi:hypothetical protein